MTSTATLDAFRQAGRAHLEGARRVLANRADVGESAWTPGTVAYLAQQCFRYQRTLSAAIQVFSLDKHQPVEALCRRVGQEGFLAELEATGYLGIPEERGQAPASFADYSATLVGAEIDIVCRVHGSYQHP